MSRRLNILLPVCALLVMGAGPTTPQGALGPLYPIAETNLLAHIKLNAAAASENGSWERKKIEAQKAAAAWVDNPPQVDGLRNATRSKVRMFDPSIKLQDPVIDAQGNVLHLPGTKVNPLQKVSLRGRLVFIDIREPAQAAYAARLLSEPIQTRVVAVAGSPSKFAKQYKKRIYFDQYGALSRRFEIVEIPAIVTQSGMALQITTVAL